jgi:sulfoxide reductase heme-binding subunit YedZ
LSYLIVILALVHFFWLVKNVYTEPAIYAAIVGLLFLLRWKPVKQQVQRWQRQVKAQLRRAS